MAISYVADGMPCGNLSTTSFAECTGGRMLHEYRNRRDRRDLNLQGRRDDDAGCDTVLGPGCMTPARCVSGGDASAGICRVPLGSACG
jgi:hypothetical protein